jgi:hypothetical protein
MILRRALRAAASIAPKVASFTPAGRIAKIASFGAGALGRLTQTAKTMLPSPISNLARTIVGKRKRKHYKGISDKEMMELLKLQMLVGKKSMPYQMAVYKALTGKLK